MSPRLALYGLLWRAALAQVHPRAHRLLLWSTPILALALAALAWGAYDATTALRWGVNAASSIVLLAWTFCYLPGAFKLNTPANAQLAPGMRARLVELSMAVWALGIAGLALGNAGATANVALTVTWFRRPARGSTRCGCMRWCGSAIPTPSWRACRWRSAPGARCCSR